MLPALRARRIILLRPKRVNGGEDRCVSVNGGRSYQPLTLARSGVGVAVPKGAVKPDISSVEAFKQSLIGARSITYSDPAAGAATGKAAQSSG